MKKLILSLAITLFSIALHAQELKTVTLLEKVTIGLPGTPVEDNAKGMPVQKVMLPDSTEVGVGVIDFSVMGLDESKLKSMVEGGEFKQQSEAMVSMQPGLTLVKNEEGKYAGKYYSYDMQVNADIEGKKSTVSSKMVIYKTYGISISYKPGNNGENDDLKNRIFNSLKIAE